MNKLLAVLLAMALAMMSGYPTLAETEAEDTDTDEAEEVEITYSELYPDVLKFANNWVSADGSFLIEAYEMDDHFEIGVVQVTGEKEFTLWEYLLEYNEADGTLVTISGEKSTNISDDEGMIEDCDYLYEDGEAVFSLNGEGQLLWQDAVEDAGAGLVFDKIGSFVGNYISGRATISMRWNAAEHVYDITIINGSVTWTLKGTGSAGSNTLEAKGTRGEGEEVTSTFTLDAEGHLVWSAPDGTGDGMSFEKEALSPWQWCE